MITVTSAEAHKLLNKLNDEYTHLLRKETQSSVFNAAVGEDIESCRPEYSFADTQSKLDAIESRIRIIKHAVNIFNTTTVIPEFGVTIDDALVLIPLLNKKKSKLSAMKSKMPKERVAAGYRTSGVIDYQYINYDIKDVEEDYKEVSDRLAGLQTALDRVNSTVTFEIDVKL